MENHDPITVGQAGKLYDVFVAALCKSGLPKEPSQQVIEHHGVQVVDEMVAVFRKHVEAISNTIVRHVSVNRSRTPQKALDATGRKQYTNESVVATMPQGKGDEADVDFFKLDRYVSDADLDKEYELRGLKPADPFTLAAVNEADPAFADKYPNGTHWKNADGEWCYLTFSRWGVERYVDCRRDGLDWDVYWWFAGLRK